jgi:hypothetical protein
VVLMLNLFVQRKPPLIKFALFRAEFFRHIGPI